jgi:hypothetical protein
MRSMIEHLFEAVETNAGHAIFAIVTSFVVTGFLRLLWE